MARKRHGGLGRGLDALIPQTRRIQPEQEQKEESEKEKPEKAMTAAETDGTTAPAQTDPEQKKENAEAQKQSVQKVSSQAGENAQKQTALEVSARAGGDVQSLSASEDPENASAGTKAAAAGSNAAEEGKIQSLRLSQVDPNRSQPRKKFEDEKLEELADSIRQFGVLQPILVQKKGGRYEIIAGERRWRATRKAGLKEIPAIVRDYSDQESVELSLIENIQREDLNPIEEARAYKRLLEEFGLRQEDLAARVSKSRTAITNAVRLLKLDERVQEMIMAEEISMGHARALIPVEIPEEQFLLAQEISDKHLSVRDVENLIRKRTSGKARKKSEKKAGETEKDPALELAYRTIEERLKQALGTKTVIHGGKDGAGKLEIDFYSHEDLEKIVELLTLS